MLIYIVLTKESKDNNWKDQKKVVVCTFDFTPSLLGIRRSLEVVFFMKLSQFFGIFGWVVEVVFWAETFVCTSVCFEKVLGQRNEKSEREEK